MKKNIIFVSAIVFILGTYFVFKNSSKEPLTFGKGNVVTETTRIQISEQGEYSLKVPKGWSSVTERSGPHGGPFINVAILRSPDFVADPQGDYDAVHKGAEIRIYPPYPSEPNVTDLSKFTDPNTVQVPVENIKVAGKPAITYIWSYEGPTLMKTVFVHNNRLYGATLQVASVNVLSDISNFDLYKSEYKAVLASLEFK